MLEKVKQYLKIDTDAEDSYLNTLITATDEYISSSFDYKKVKFTSLYENTQLMLIGLLYNSRGLTEGKENKTLNTIFNAMILKLKTSNEEGVEDESSTDEE